MIIKILGAMHYATVLPSTVLGENYFISLLQLVLLAIKPRLQRRPSKHWLVTEDLYHAISYFTI